MEIATARDDHGRAIATVRHAHTRMVMALGVDGVMTYAPGLSDAERRAVDALADGWRDGLRVRHAV